MKYRQAKKNLKNKLRGYLIRLSGNPFDAVANQKAAQLMQELRLLRLNK